MDNLELLTKDFCSKTRYTQDLRTKEKYFPEKEMREIIKKAYDIGVIDGSLSIDSNAAMNAAMNDMELLGEGYPNELDDEDWSEE